MPTIRLPFTPAIRVMLAVLLAALVTVAVAVSMRHGGPVHTGAFLYNGHAMRPAFLYNG